MTWLAVLAAFGLAGCVVVGVVRMRRRRARSHELETREKPPLDVEPADLRTTTDPVDTRPYDVHACGVQVLESLVERERVSSSAFPSVHETPTREVVVSLAPRNSLATDDELAVSLMAEDGLIVRQTPALQSGRFPIHPPTSREDERVQQATEAHVVPRSLTRKQREG
jgi:hypothetical protein